MDSCPPRSRGGLGWGMSPPRHVFPIPGPSPHAGKGVANGRLSPSSHVAFLKAFIVNVYCTAQPRSREEHGRDADVATSGLGFDPPRASPGKPGELAAQGACACRSRGAARWTGKAAERAFRTGRSISAPMLARPRALDIHFRVIGNLHPANSVCTVKIILVLVHRTMARMRAARASNLSASSARSVFR